MDREDRLFDTYERDDSKPRSYNEPTFCFWNRSAWPKARAYRDLSERIFGDYPQGRRKDMRRRFRSKQGNQHESALLELLLFAVLRPFNVRVRPDTPDFEFNPGQRTCLLEATACREPEDMPVLLQDILDDINSRMSSSDYYLQVSGRGRLTRKPPFRKYRGPIEKLLQTPRSQVVPERLETWPTENIPLHEYGNRDSYGRECALQVQLIPGSPQPDARLIGMPDFGEASWLLDDEERGAGRILDAVREKASKMAGYGNGYIAVSLPEAFLLDTTDAAPRALYGVSRELARLGIDSPGDYLWRPGARDHIQGVVVLGKLLPYALDVPAMICRLYMAPGAHEPPEPLSRLPRVWLEGSELRSQPGETLGALVRDGLGVSL